MSVCARVRVCVCKLVTRGIVIFSPFGPEENSTEPYRFSCCSGYRDEALLAGSGIGEAFKTSSAKGKEKISTVKSIQDQGHQ